MQKRVTAISANDSIGEKIVLKGWVDRVRTHGKIAFFDLRDRSAVIQVAAFDDLAQKVSELSVQDVVEVEGEVKARGEKYENPDLSTGRVEIKLEKIDLIAKAAEMPFDMGGKELNLELPTLLDFRSLTLRHQNIRPIFKIQEAIVDGFRKAARELECTEVFTPTISYSSTEGGAEVFPIDYYGHKAFMIQSPQLYKQMMVPTFERVYLMSHAYRAEPSVTTRHLSESTQMDCELGFMEFDELMDALEYVGSQTVIYASEKHPEILKQFGVPAPKIPTKIPRLKMRDAQQIIFDKFGRDVRHEPDLGPEDEKDICQWALSEHGSDLVTITHFPLKKRAFYTHPDPEDPEFSLSYDLLFRGIEILSGSKRIHDYETLIGIIKERGMNPSDFEMYLQAFKFGMPPHGGFSFGLERMTMKLLELKNVREASLFPRDMERIDLRFSQHEGK
ncbi:MAG TPA: aspartate--tRNA(Asn) ligase [Patescibacteria group bacterium]|nr:aspartate--tRNA(Asn) ligase [Patescibacteria group bacterium]